METLLRLHDADRSRRTTGRDIYLDTLDFMRPARRLYESVGFRTLRTKDLGRGVRLVTYRRRREEGGGSATTSTETTTPVDETLLNPTTPSELPPPSFDTNTLVHIEGIGVVVVERTGRREVKFARSSTDPYNRLSVRQNRKLEWTRSSQTSRGASGRNAAFEFVASATSAYHFAFRSVAFKKKGWYVSASTSSVSLSVASAPVFLRCVERSTRAFAMTTTTTTTTTSESPRKEMPSSDSVVAPRVRSCTLREALACDESSFTRDAIRRDGVLVVRGAISSEKIARALRRINHGIGQPNGLVPGGVQPLTYKLDGKHANAADVRRLFPHALVRAIVGDYEAPKGCQIALRYPEYESEDEAVEDVDVTSSSSAATSAAPLSGRMWHTDPLRQGKFHPFSLLVGIALSDTTASDREGNFCVFPGKHVEIGRRTTLNGRLRGVDDVSAEKTSMATKVPPASLPFGTTVSPLTPWGSKDRPLPDLGPPVPVRLKRGDVVLCHVDMPHRGGPNHGANIRYMCYFRVRHRRITTIVDAMRSQRRRRCDRLPAEARGDDDDDDDDLFADLQGPVMSPPPPRSPSRKKEARRLASPATQRVITSSIPSSFRVLSPSQIETFRRDGFVVVPNILSDKQIARARADFKATLRELCGFDEDRMSETAEKIRSMSSTGGAGGVLDMFYAPFKLRLSLANARYADAYADLLAATYATNAGIYAHDFGPFDPYRPLAHIDRVGYRLPDLAWSGVVEDGDSSSSSSRKRRVQRSLTPHLDCAPLAMNACVGKAFKRWRPIQCLLSLSDTLEQNQGGFEAIPGFHREFRSYFSERRSRNSIVSVSDFTSIRAKELVSRVRHVPVPRGAAVFWDQRVVHANSARNDGDVPRVCVYGGFLPRVSRNVAYAKEQLRRARNRMPQTDFWMHPTKPYAEAGARGDGEKCDPVESLLYSLRDSAEGEHRRVLSLLGEVSDADRD